MAEAEEAKYAYASCGHQIARIVQAPVTAEFRVVVKMRENLLVVEDGPGLNVELDRLRQEHRRVCKK